VNCKRVGVVVLDLRPHAHLHLGANESHGRHNFANAKLKLSKEEFSKVMEDVKSNFA